MTQIKEVIRYLESIAPKTYAESYDNPGLIVGDDRTEVTAVLTSLDCTEAVVDEAVAKGCNLIVSHHPIVFMGLKKLNGSNYVERTVIKAIRHGVALYATHTNLDSVPNGVNGKLAEILGLQFPKILVPREEALLKLTYFVPTDKAEQVRHAVFAAGAGVIGSYAECSFSQEGTGTYTPLDGANPFSGKIGQREEAPESRVEVMLPSYLKNAVLQSLFQAHPYEEVAYYLQHLANANQYVGTGLIAEMPRPVGMDDFLRLLKERLELKVVRHTHWPEGHMVKKVALCGGSGSFLLQEAKRAGADAFVTADFKYHEFFDAENSIVVADVGHYESERFTIDLMAGFLTKKFSTFATHLTEVNTNPVQYYI